MKKTKKEAEKSQKPQNEAEDGKWCAVLSYIVIGIIWYFAEDKMKKNGFARFHVKQAIVLIITSLVLQVALRIIPFIGVFLAGLASILILVLWIIGLVYAFSAEEKELPMIGKLSKSLKF